MCRDAVRKAKPQVKWKFVRDVKNYKKEFFRYYDGLDHDKYMHAPTPMEESSIRTTIKLMG